MPIILIPEENFCSKAVYDAFALWTRTSIDMQSMRDPPSPVKPKLRTLHKSFWNPQTLFLFGPRGLFPENLFCMSKPRDSVRDPRDSYIAEVVKGRSFADVGGLWHTVNEKISFA